MIDRAELPHTEIKYSSHCPYKGEGIVLDMQYNFDGTLLAIGYSNGDVCIYDFLQDSRRNQIYCLKDHKGGVLKLSWSIPIFGRCLASCSIDKHILIYDLVDVNIKPKSIELPCIPVSIGFCPWDERLILVAGLSNGHLKVYSDKFTECDSVEAHEMSINCVCWSNEIVVSNQRIEWVKKSLKNVEIYMPEEARPLLATVSSDKFMKIWRMDIETGKLEKLCYIEAHQKYIREVSWKPNLFIGKIKTLITCSEDMTAKLWELSPSKKITLKHQIDFPGIVWRVQWNPLGSAVAISHSNEKEHLETVLYVYKYGTLVYSSKFK